MCESLFQIQTEFENEYISEKILSKDTNLEILNSINFKEFEYSIDELKNVLDDYIENKINRVKPEKTETIKLMTYSSTGLTDIKYTLDYKSFIEFQDLTNDFEIMLNYITGSVYSLIIKQKEFELIGSITIDDAISLIKKEIKKRALEKKIQNQIVV
jgi:hypothetical protein